VRLIEVPGQPRSTLKSDADVWARYAQPNQVFLNDGQGHFELLGEASCGLCSPPAIARGVAEGDLDGDGDVDLLFGMLGGPLRLYENVAPRSGHWLRLKVVDPRLKRDVHGAQLAVSAGGRTLVGAVTPNTSYLSSSDPRVTFGLGPATAVDEVTVTWPDGRRERFAGSCVDCEHRLERGSGEVLQ
jgi:hypothetical protein